VRVERLAPPVEACWFPVPTPDDREALEAWASDVAAHWATTLRADEEEAEVVREAVTALGTTYFDPTAPVRGFWFMPGTTGVMFDFSARSAPAGVPWPEIQRELLQEYCAEAVATEWLTSDTPGVSATIALSTFDDPESAVDAFGNTAGVAQIVASVRCRTHEGEVDLVGRAIDGDADLIEMSAYAVVSLLHGDEDLLAAVQG
jgi:hypothetical protein